MDIKKLDVKTVKMGNRLSHIR